MCGGFFLGLARIHSPSIVIARRVRVIHVIPCRFSLAYAVLDATLSHGLPRQAR